MERITKEAICAVAIDLFLKKGYSQVTIMDICKACNITKPTFYRYVSTKEDLIVNFYDTTINNLVIDTYRFLESETNYEQLLLVFHTLIGTTQDYGSHLFSQMLASNLMEDRHSFDMRDDLTKLCVMIIRKGQKAGEFQNPNDPEVLYRTLAFAFTGYECMWCIKKGSLDWEKQFTQSMEHLLDVRTDLKRYE